MIDKRQLLTASVLTLLLSAPLIIATRPLQAQTETVLYNFCSDPSCADGVSPTSSLTADGKGNYYGTTNSGGASEAGTVFELSPNGNGGWNETVLYSFTGKKDGVYPFAGLVQDASGNFYGTTVSGGAKNKGTLFKVTPAGTETVVHSFGEGDGKQPYAGLIMDAQGNLYGTYSIGPYTTKGGVFKITPDGTETVLWSFRYAGDGKSPYAGLVMDAQGNLYGTTSEGGSAGYAGPGRDRCDHGCGTVFELSPTGSETILYAFEGERKNDGAGPFYAGLVMDAQGNLYGTTDLGGAFGYGTVFKVTPAGTETLLYTFTGGTDGGSPFAGLLLDARGNLYGTTYRGGLYNEGTVFEVSASGTEGVLYSFTGGADGASPQAGLVMDAQGNLYGTASAGGSSGAGAVFEVTP
ncbi:MAG: choice-of-anchor tandem repeat GloVer-containing protein [Terriglobales bacterium]